VYVGRNFYLFLGDNTGSGNNNNKVVCIVVAGFDSLSSCRDGVPAPSQADPMEKFHPEEKAKGENLPQYTHSVHAQGQHGRQSVNEADWSYKLLCLTQSVSPLLYIV
jgi:hypothetical protein